MIPPLNTPVQVARMPLKLDFEDTVVSFGSCFSDEIGNRLKTGGFDIEINPFGTLYNPASVADAVERIINRQELTAADLVQQGGLWHSWHHHGSFSRPTADECLELCNSRLHSAHKTLGEATLMLVTFGTSWVFSLLEDKDNGSGRVVANCHKLPPQMFQRHMMSVNEIVALWQPLLQKLSAFNHRLSVLFTVSPIRHMADGAHGNQLSKSTLLLAIEQLIESHPAKINVVYFPAYEIVLDELRDYRFYDSDMTHPSPLAVDIVYDRFQQSCMSPATIQQAHNNAKQAKRAGHIPLH